MLAERGSGNASLAPARDAAPLPPDAAHALAQARRDWDANRLDAAARALEGALAMAPGDARLVRMLGMVARRQGDYAKAVACFRDVLATWSDDPFLRADLGLSLLSLGDTEPAVEHFRRACALAPDVAGMWFNLGEAQWRQARGAGAIAAFERALRLEPAHLEARLSLARALAGMGRIDAALAAFREVLRRDPANGDGWYGLSLTAKRLDAAEAACLRQAFARADLPPRTHYLLGFALARALEDQGEYDAAFAALEAANAAQRDSSPAGWNPAAEQRELAAILDAFRRNIAGNPDASAGQEAIFIVGMPRSGSTLVEQILASHPEVAGANEIQDLPGVLAAESRRRGLSFPAWVAEASAADWQRLGRQYLAQTARWRADKPRCTDKNLMNWRLVGAALAMLPAARIVIVRRDPLENCLACYRHCFTEAAGFAQDLDALAAYCGDFLRASRFWLDAYPARVIELHYETLVADPQPVIRRLLEFCQLPFAAACLAPDRTARAVTTPSAAQVREPIHGGPARSQRYGARLDGLRQRLREAGALDA